MECAGIHGRLWASDKWNPFPPGCRGAKELLLEFHRHFYVVCTQSMWEMLTDFVVNKWVSFLTLLSIYSSSEWPSILLEWVAGIIFFPMESVHIISLHCFRFCGLFVSLYVLGGRTGGTAKPLHFSGDFWIITLIFLTFLCLKPKYISVELMKQCNKFIIKKKGYILSSVSSLLQEREQ